VADDLGDKTELPTQRRLEEARNKGQVARSTDLGAAIDLVGAVALLIMLGGAGASIAGRMMRIALAGETPGDASTVQSVMPSLAWAGRGVLMITIPAMLILFVFAGIGQVLQVGWKPTLEPLRPKLDRLNPVNGAKRLFQRRNLVKSLVAIVKLMFATAVAVLVIWRNLEAAAGLPMLGVKAGAARIGLMMLELAAWLLALLLLIGLLDFLYQKWQHTQDLKMTKREVKDERRSMDGDPEMKSRRHRMAQQVALQRVQGAVPHADVVVTNPTHFSVALQYDQETMQAPRVVAKGADLLAFRIREVAARSKVPVVERPPLARALYYTVREGQDVPAEFYEAVAEVLAYVYRLEGRAA